MPAPGPKMMPWELNPAATKSPGTSGHVPELEVRVGREALGRAQVVREADRLDLGHALARALQHGREVVPVGAELHEAVGRDLAGALRLPVGLERADQVAAPVVTDVQVRVEVAQERGVLAGALGFLGHDPDVLGRVERDARAGRARQLARPQSRGEHDGLGLDRAARRVERRPPGPSPSARKPVTSVSGTYRAPRSTAPLANASAASPGFTVPSVGNSTAPTRSSTTAEGHRSFTAAGSSTSTSTPASRAIATP